MKELFEAVYAHYLLDPLANSMSGLYNTEAPQEAKFPFGVFLLVSNVQDFTFSENFENCLVQFNLFSSESSPVEISNLYELLKGDTVSGTGFDFLELFLDNYETVSLQREVATLTKVENIWQYNVSYRCVLQYSGEVVHVRFCGNLYNFLSI